MPERNPAVHYLEAPGSKKTRCGKPAKGLQTTDRYEDVSCKNCIKLIDKDLGISIKHPENGIKARRLASIDLEQDIEGNKEEILATLAICSPQQIYGYLITWKRHRGKEREQHLNKITALQEEIEQLKRSLKIVCDTCPKKAAPISIPEQQRKRILYTAYSDIERARSEEEVEQALSKIIEDVENLFKPQGVAP